MNAKPRIHSVDTFIHVLYKLGHPEEIIPCTKILYNYIHQGLSNIKPIDLPKLVCIRKRTKKRLETSVEQRFDTINDRSTFEYWVIDSVLGLKTAGESSIIIWIERQASYTFTIKLPEKKAEYVNQAGLNYIESYPIKSITADNGTEFALLSELEGVDSYFAHALSYHERGTNENFNGLLREFVPKGISLYELIQEEYSSHQ